MTIIVFVVFARLSYSGIPYMVKRVTDAMVEFGGNYQEVYVLLGFLVGIITVSAFCYRVTGFAAARWVPRVEVFAAQKSFDYLMMHSARYFSDRLSGKLQSKVFNIANAVAGIFPIIFWNFTDLFVKLGTSIILAFSVHVLVGSIFLGFIVVSIVFSSFVARRLSRYSLEKADAASETRGVMVDIISNILAVKQNVAISRESKRVMGVLGSYEEKSVRNWRFFELVLLVNGILVITMFGVVSFTSVYLWQIGTVSVGDLTMLIILMLGLYGDLQFLSMSFNRFMEQYGQLREGLEEVYVPYEISDSEKKNEGIIHNGEITFRDVSFQYEEDDTQAVFERLCLNISAGEKIGLVGESGAGKSTFVSLLLRFFEPDSGKISIDGNNVLRMKQNELRDAIAYVPQESLLFHRSLRENISYGNVDATEKELNDAMHRSHSYDFIKELPKGLDTLVGERGVKLSGGQKQRVMIARAMLKKSPILVLDEATSALDSESENLIQKALENLMENRTTIIIAHRLSTLKKMDRIVVFDDGRIIEDGTHEELLKDRGKYYELWQYQSGGGV